MPLHQNYQWTDSLLLLLITKEGRNIMALCWRTTVDNSFPLSLAKIKVSKYFIGNVVIELWVLSKCVSCYMNVSSTVRKA